MVILVVEDEALIAQASAAELAEAGYAVIGPATSSQQALALARERSPDVALIDIDLETPGAGVALARELNRRYGTVVVFTTAQAEVARANADCAIGLLAKPYDPRQLPSVIAYAQAIRDGARRTLAECVQTFEHFDRRQKSSRTSCGAASMNPNPQTA